MHIFFAGNVEDEFAAIKLALHSSVACTLIRADLKNFNSSQLKDCSCIIIGHVDSGEDEKIVRVIVDTIKSEALIVATTEQAPMAAKAISSFMIHDISHGLHVLTERLKRQTFNPQKT